MRYLKSPHFVLAVCSLILLTWPAAGRAATFGMSVSGNDMNTAIWTNAANLTPVVPVASNTYVLPASATPLPNNNGNPAYYVRATTSGGAEFFKGDSLTLGTNTTIRLKNAPATITFTNASTPGAAGLILNGGVVEAGDDTLSIFTVAGAIQTLPGTQSYLDTAQNTFYQTTTKRPMNISAKISGSGDLIVVGGQSTFSNITISGTANYGFSGNWIVEGGWLVGLNPGSLGTNSNFILDRLYPIPYTYGIGTAPSTKFEPCYDLNSAGTLTMANGAKMRLHQNCFFTAVTIEGLPLSNDTTYSYATLLSMFPNSFDAGGSGSITVQAYNPNPAPRITGQPLSQEVYAGVTSPFIVVASSPISTSPLSYQWQRSGTNLLNGGNISGVNTATLTVSNASAADAANYDVVISNLGGSVTSIVASLTLTTPTGEVYEHAVLTNTPIAFYEFNETGDPSTNNTPAFDFVGGHVGLYGTAVQNGNPNYLVAGPTPSAGFSGFSANNAAIQMFNAQPAGQITLPALNLNTNTVTLSAWINPSSGQMAHAGLIVCRAGTTAAGLGYTANQDANGNYTLGYTWNSSPWDFSLAAPPGQWSFVTLVVSPTNAILYLINANGLLSTSHTLSHVNQAFDAATLIGDDSADGGSGARVFSGAIDDVAVFNHALSRQQVLALYTAASGTSTFAPIIGLQPASKARYVGLPTSFSVIADGSLALFYQWQAGATGSGTYTNVPEGAIFSGTTTATLTLPSPSLANVADYVVIVSNAYGVVTTSPATLTVVPVVGSYAGAMLTDQPVAFYELNETNDPSGGNVTAFDYYGGYNGTYGVTARNGNANYNVVGPRPSDNLPGFPANNTAAAFTYSDGNSQVVLPALNLNTNAVTLTAWIYPNTQPQAHAVGVVFCRGGTSVAGLTYSGGQDTNGNYTLGYNWNNDTGTTGWNSGLVPVAGQWSFVALVVTPTDATIYVITTNSLKSATHVFNHVPVAFDGVTYVGNDHTDGSGLRVFDGTIDDVAVFNRSFSQLDLQNLIAAAGIPPIPPTITVQPASKTVYAGINAKFSVTANGWLLLSYRWRAGAAASGSYTNLADGGNLIGTGTPNLTINNSSAANAGDYVVVITNTGGSVTSSVANLSIIPVSAYGAAVVSNNPLAYYPLNETGDPSAGNITAFDYAGGFNGTYAIGVSNAFYGVTGPRPADGFPFFPAGNAAIQLANSNANSYVLLPALNLNTNSVTFTAWLYPVGQQQVGSSGIIFSRNNGTVAGFIYSGSHALGLNWNDVASETAWASGVVPPSNQWSLVALVITPTNATVYSINTNSAVSSTLTGFSNAPAGFAGVTRIGDDQWDEANTGPTSGPGGRAFNGKIDEVAIFSHALSVSNMATLYAAASGVALVPPSTTGPANQTLNVGQTAQFTVAVTGTAPFSYQWQAGAAGSGIFTNLVDGGQIAGSATATLTINNLTLANTADLRVLASNLMGSTASSVARLTVVSAPSPISLTFSGNHLSLSWSNGLGILLQSTNVTLPMANWTPVVTNPPMPYVITVNPSTPEIFYRTR